MVWNTGRGLTEENEEDDQITSHISFQGNNCDLRLTVFT